MGESTNEIILKISKKIKQLRLEKGFTSYRNFADEYDIDAKQYWRMEEGKIDFRQSSLMRILEIHNISLEEFFKGFNEPKK